LSHDRLPVDPDTGLGPQNQSARPGQGTLRRPWGVVLAILVGGFAGGLARYGLVVAWPTASLSFPWAIVTVNCIGPFILALLIVLVTDVLKPSRLLRPLLGTGFCGAFTTFSTVVVAAAELTAHGRSGTAALLVVASIAGGLAAAAVGLAAGRSIASRTRISATELAEGDGAEDGDTANGDTANGDTANGDTAHGDTAGGAGTP
jgi:fluoride exporter